MNYEEVTYTFLALSAGSAHIKDDGSLSCFMIVLAALVTLMKLAKNCSQRRDEQWMLFLQQKQLLCSTLKEVVCQGGHCWGEMLQVNLDIPTPGNGLTPTTGNHCGPHYSSPVLHPENYFAVGAGKCKCRKAALKCTALCHCGGDYGGECDM